MSGIDAELFRAWSPEEVAALFLAELIHFRSYTQISGEYVRTDLISNMEYPFITEYFNNFISYSSNRYNGSEEVQSFSIETITDLKLIENIGSHLKYTPQYYSEYKIGTMSRLHYEEIEFNFIHLRFLAKELNKIYNKLNRHISKASKKLRTLDTQGAEAKKNATDLQKKKDDLRKQFKKLPPDEEEKLTKFYQIVDFCEEEINGINRFMIPLKKQYNIICDKVTLVSYMLNYCRYEMQTRARQHFSKRLKTRMDAKNILSDEIQNILQIKQQTYSDYLNSKTLPENMKLIVLANTLGCSVDYLLGLSDTLDFRAYRSHFAFKKLGFSEDAFNNLVELRQNHAHVYSEAITTLNTLLEEADISTLNYISKYLSHNNLNDYLTIKKEDIDNLQDRISVMLELGSTPEDISEAFRKFKQDLPGQTISVDESTIMLNIQQNLSELKAANAGYYNSRVGELYGNLWASGLSNNPLGTDTTWENEDDEENIEDSELEEYDYNDTAYDYHIQRNDYLLDIEEFVEVEPIDKKDSSLPFNE